MRSSRLCLILLVSTEPLIINIFLIAIQWLTKRKVFFFTNFFSCFLICLYSCHSHQLYLLQIGNRTSFLTGQYQFWRKLNLSNFSEYQLHIKLTFLVIFATSYFWKHKKPIWTCIFTIVGYQFPRILHLSKTRSVLISRV